MKYIYMIKYIMQNALVLLLVILGDAPPVNESFYYKTQNHFTRPSDRQKAFKIYLKDKGIESKPYFLKDGFQLKIDFKMSVIALDNEELRNKYPVSRN